MLINIDTSLLLNYSRALRDLTLAHENKANDEELQCLEELVESHETDIALHVLSQSKFAEGKHQCCLNSQTT